MCSGAHCVDNARMRYVTEDSGGRAAEQREHASLGERALEDNSIRNWLDWPNLPDPLEPLDGLTREGGERAGD